MKTEIEHIQHLLQKSKVQVQRDFEEWWSKKSRSSVNKSTMSPRAAWHTPPPHLSGLSANQSHQEQTRLSRVSPTSSHCLRRHQEAIAAQFSHLQQSAGSEDRLPQQPPGSRGEHRTGQDWGEGRRDGTKTYHSSRQPAGGGSGAEHGTGQDHRGGRRDGTKPGSLYHSSWQQADSLSPPVAASDVQTRRNERTPCTRSPQGTTKSPEQEYLSKKKHLFPADTDHSLHSHSLRCVLVSWTFGFVVEQDTIVRTELIKPIAHRKCISGWGHIDSTSSLIMPVLIDYLQVKEVWVVVVVVGGV